MEFIGGLVAIVALLAIPFGALMVGVMVGYLIGRNSRSM